jgi:hypothetical protein
MEVYGDNLRCVCPAGSITTPDGCVACGEHEMSTGSACVCEEGYSRPAAGAPCVEAPSGLGMECDPAAPTCPAPYDHCEPAGASGYCTSACSAPEECSGGYACNSASICQRPPAGLGKACETPADCAGTEATYCDTIVSHACQVEGCSVAPNNCFAGFDCCDLSGFGVPVNLCVPTGQCLTP